MTHRVLITLVLLLTFACGDDDDDKVTPTSPPASTAAGEEATPTPAAPDEVTFMAGFRAQANLPFVGVYVAEEMGFFADENLAVEIQHVTTPGDNFRFLATGDIQFSTADATALLEKWTTEPIIEVVSLALIGQTGQQAFAVLEDSDIETPADWAGKTAGYKGGDLTPDFLAVLEANGLTRDDVEAVRVGFEPQILTEGTVDIFPVFVSNEPDTLERLGYPTRLFTAAEYGAPTLGLSYVTTGDFAAEQPDITARFTRAVLRGIAWADENRETAINIVLQYAAGADREHQRYMLDTEFDMAKTGGVYGDLGIGGQTLEQWRALHDFLIEHGALPAEVPDISAVFTEDFAAYEAE
ncbi:MAG TPA: ABC transporter substrate-binding protein [Dehalococcoidia bacterium]|nr:ABC transporter substrate-binding protein [Dehalococcoidia bacterium]